MAGLGETSEARALGEALAALRRDCGLSQAEAGARIGMTGQGWGLYEAGKRSSLFRPDVQRRLTGALGATPEALMLQAPGGAEVSTDRPKTSHPDNAPAHGLSARGRAFEAPPRTCDGCGWRRTNWRPGRRPARCWSTLWDVGRDEAKAV